MSIIIVGVGNESFQNMIRLDGDGGLTSPKGNIKCPRDIVQFVPFNKFQGNAEAMAAELLKEIPYQITQYFTMMNKMPQAPQQINMGTGMDMGMGMGMGNMESMQKNLGPQLFQFFSW